MGECLEIQRTANPKRETNRQGTQNNRMKAIKFVHVFLSTVALGCYLRSLPGVAPFLAVHPAVTGDIVQIANIFYPICSICYPDSGIPVRGVYKRTCLMYRKLRSADGFGVAGSIHN